jgi:nicotinate-nucleotide adenylyltransferase
MRIGVFGGSFNPPHIAHLIIAELLRERFSLDKVLWIPSAQPPHKPQSELAPASDRLEMTRLATRDHSNFEVTDLELRREGPSYTLDTILQLKSDAPSHDYLLMIGGDSLAQFHTWHRPDAILREVPLLVYDRTDGGEAFEGVPSDRLLRTEVPLLEISSTEIRRRCAAGETIRYLVPDAVADYLHEHRLYRS